MASVPIGSSRHRALPIGDHQQSSLFVPPFPIGRSHRHLRHYCQLPAVVTIRTVAANQQ
jgi:hypothetical protein